MQPNVLVNSHGETMPHRRKALYLAILLLLTACLANQALAKECLECHPDIASQLQGKSHHVQGIAVSGRHCYACHWEAKADGEIDERYHRRDGRIDLVLWGDGSRPADYSLASSAVSYVSTAVGSGEERRAFADISRHCLSCHSDRNNGSTPFAGDPNTPGTYAWDRESIASRYADKGVTTWGKYSTVTGNRKKQVIKAFSAHGNSATNKGGWSPGSGYDGSIPATRGGSAANNVECFDCHNAHGSTVAGTTTSYRSAGGSPSGGLLKQTAAGKGGYRTDYTPAANPDRTSSNPYNPGAGLCFDCHETATAGITPWGYSSTFGASEPIMGYKDTHRFGPGIKGSTSRYASRQGRSGIISSHLKAGAFLRYSAAEAINGLCTPCHDPHGISRTLGEKRAYAVPLLKGTWLTSPYREDAPPAVSPGKSAAARQSGGPAAVVSGSSRGPVSLPGMQYNVDRNTFGPAGRISEDVGTFAGLCLRCHAGVKPVGESKMARIHRSVKGWGENREHAFPCSKCHQAHNSGLPRLMQTNCFEEGPAGLRDNIGLSWLPEKKGNDLAGKSSGKSAAKTAARKTEMTGCHVRQFGRGGMPGQKQDSREWQEKSKW
jgi:hypothetical protein